MERGFQALLLEGESSASHPPAFNYSDGDLTAVPVTYGGGFQAEYLKTEPYYEFISSNQSFQKLPELRSLEHLHHGGVTAAKREDSLELPLAGPYYEFISASSSDLCFRSLEQLRHGGATAEKRGIEPYYDDLCFRRLPELRSLDGELERKRARSNWLTRSPEVAENEAPANDVARRRKQQQQIINEKMRCLQELLPLNRKMDKSTMLGEAHKYVRFLQAQVSVLHSMPAHASTNFQSTTMAHVSPAPAYGGPLAALSRQQLLQVLMNSQVAQTALSTKGYCVYSFEQVAMLREKIIQSNNINSNELVLQQRMF